MESNHNNQENNNLWIGELDQSMDENYLKESCKKYSKINILITESFVFYRY